MNSSSVAAVILAHGDSRQVQRLCEAMRGVDLFLHCDLRTSNTEFEAMTHGVDRNVHLLPRLPTKRTSWSLVNAELQALRTVIDRSSAAHIIVMSGSCYPLVSAEELIAELAAWRCKTRIRHTPLPHPPWGTPRNRDGGFWRFRRRFVVIRDQTLHVRGVPLRTIRRRIPSALILHAGSQWKIYARNHVERLLAVLAERPDLITFFRHTYVPDESCIPTILKSPELVGSIADDVVPDLSWYIEWPAVGQSPNWLAPASFENIRRARMAPPRHPAGGGEDSAYRKLFARKVRSSDTELLDRIDGELRR